MGSFNQFLSFTLIACGISISPTCGFAKGQFCGSLYKDVDLGGETFNMTEGLEISNLDDEYVNINGTWVLWNVTASFHVESGCTLKACNESYFNGDCRDFKEQATELPPSYGNILSIKCSCPKACRCEDVYSIRKNSCGRAYLFEGGCTNCVPYYTDLKEGEFETFPEVAEKNVTSIMVRPGCTLMVYEEENLLGEPKSVENIVAKWTGWVKSYECSCEMISEDKLPETNPTERPTEYPAYIDVPDSLDGISEMMKGDLRNHPGLLAALQSNKRKRSTKNAYIVLLGSTGAGKSSTINMLFDSPNLTRIGDSSSTTKAIHEFRIPISVNELGIQNSELRVIDTPGLGDTEGLDQDARFLATLEEYLDGHEELKNRIPNLVLIFHKFSDNRYAGEGSQFVKMIRGLDSFRDRLTDKSYSNVIFVFSHFTSETQKVRRNPKDKLKKLKKVIEEYSRFPRPVVLAVAENKAEENGLMMLNGYYKLPNGDYYPKNLFDRITQVTHGSADAIGDAVIRSAFKNPDCFNISSSDFSLAGNQSSKVSKYLGILSAAVFSVNKTEVSNKLAVAYESMPVALKQRFPDALYYLQKSLNLGNYIKVTDLPRTTTAIVKLISELRQNDAVLFLLQKAFDITPPVFPEKVLTGYSYNVFQDHALPLSPFDLGQLQDSEIGYKLPAMITCNVEFHKKDILHFLQNRNEYMVERFKSMQVAGSVPVERFTGAIKPGYNVFDQITTMDGVLFSPITAVREIRTFELILNDRFKLNNEFKNTVNSLPPYNASDYQSVDLWNTFFSQYGTHVVKAAYGGGAIEITVKANSTMSPEIQGVLVSKLSWGGGVSRELACFVHPIY